METNTKVVKQVENINQYLLIINIDMQRNRKLVKYYKITEEDQFTVATIATRALPLSSVGRN